RDRPGRLADLHRPHPAAASSARASAVSLALSKVGSPYRWGASGPSAFDCSGLVNWAFERAGIDVPRTSRALSQTGTPVSRGDLRPGDLVFFYSPVSHVGIYIGDGQMVHASTSGKPVAIASIDRSSYNSARRI
ncbi:C40 family peptidase, partial [Pseudonocardia sp. KRD-188]|uniref:NlpC/P60 family protein n=1 Tax=Pseudonocardia oceani TaxID=2792013 RepID=UPI001C4A06F7